MLVILVLAIVWAGAQPAEPVKVASTKSLCGALIRFSPNPRPDLQWEL